jgi:hypothetical protein
VFEEEAVVFVYLRGLAHRHEREVFHATLDVWDLCDGLWYGDGKQQAVFALGNLRTDDVIGGIREQGSVFRTMLSDTREAGWPDENHPLYFKDYLRFMYKMQALKEEILEERKRTRVDKDRLYEILAKLADVVGEDGVGGGAPGPRGPVGPQGPQGPRGKTGEPGTCACKCVTATAPPVEAEAAPVPKKKTATKKKA